ncbi:MAG: T9SS type A sorting domain-containing protein [bacterium]
MPRARILSLVLLGTWISPAFASAFESIGPDGGSIQGFAQSASTPTRLVALPSRQGVFRSDDRGDSWSRVDVDLPRETAPLDAITISPFDSDLLLLHDSSVPTALRRSTDGGVTWNSVPVGASWSECRDISFAPLVPGVVLVSVGGSGGLFRSTDDGLSWTAAGIGPGNVDPHHIAWHPTNPGEALLANETSIVRTTDAGATWTPSASVGTFLRFVSYCDTDPTRVWAAGGQTGYQRSTDSGLTFTAITYPSCGIDCGPVGIVADPVDPDRAYATRFDYYCTADCWGRASQVVTTTNGGASWESLGTSFSAPYFDEERLTALRFDVADPDRVYLVTSTERFTRGLRRSTDGGATWSDTVDGLSGTAIHALAPATGGAIWAAGGSRLWRAPSPGAPWTAGPLALGSSGVTFPFPHPAIQGVVFQAGWSSSFDTGSPSIKRSTDDGQTWSALSIDPFGLFETPVCMAAGATASSPVWLWIDTGVLHRSDDGGVTFPIQYFHSWSAAAMVVDPTDDSRAFAIGAYDGSVRLTTDGGATWTARDTGLPTGLALNLVLDPSDPGRLAAVYRSQGVWRSDDAGVTWTDRGVLPGVTLRGGDWDPATDRFFLATASQGPWIEGTGFVTAGLATTKCTSIVRDPTSGQILVGTEHAGVWAMDPSSATDSPVVAAPLDSGLELVARPNPARSSVAFDVRTPAGLRPELAIYDVAGRRVTALPIVTRADGSGCATWDALDASGRRVAPGVYFARVVAGTSETTRRVVVLQP